MSHGASWHGALIMDDYTHGPLTARRPSVLILRQMIDEAAGRPIVCVRACCSVRCFACVCSIIKVNLLYTLLKHVENSSLQLRNSMLNLIQIVWLLFTAFSWPNRVSSSFLLLPFFFFFFLLSSYNVRTLSLPARPAAAAVFLLLCWLCT